MEKRGFTPIFDDIAETEGLVRASVYGCVWRHEQMADGECYASVDTMGRLLGMSEATVRRHLKGLEQKGWITKTAEYTPRSPAHYVCCQTPAWVAQKESVQYHEYLQSAEWQKRRADAVARAGNRCQLCNGVGMLHVHHRTYERLGKEKASDLIVLCEHCHAQFHGKLIAEG